jgi:hypothetical protein
MIEATSHHLRLPIGVFALRIPAIRLHGIAVQPAIHIMEIIRGKPLEHLPFAAIPARSFAATEVLAYDRDALAVEALPPGHDFTRRQLQLRRIEIPTEKAWSCRRVGESGIQTFQHLDLDPAVGHTRRNVRRMNFY